METTGSVINLMTVNHQHRPNVFIDSTDEVPASDLRIGDRVGRAGWTIETMHLTEELVLATGHSARGDRFVLSTKPTRKVHVWRT